MAKPMNPRIDVFNAELVRDARRSKVHEFPLLKKTSYVPERMVSFPKRHKAVHNQWLHFYVNDYEFEGVWDHPLRHLETLRRFDGVITPDFSVYLDMPVAWQIWNIYRSRAIGY